MNLLSHDWVTQVSICRVYFWWKSGIWVKRMDMAGDRQSQAAKAGTAVCSLDPVNVNVWITENYRALGNSCLGFVRKRQMMIHQFSPVCNRRQNHVQEEAIEVMLTVSLLVGVVILADLCLRAHVVGDREGKASLSETQQWTSKCSWWKPWTHNHVHGSCSAKCCVMKHNYIMHFVFSPQEKW